MQETRSAKRFYKSETHFQPPESIHLSTGALLAAGVLLGQPLRLFTSAQVRRLSTTIVMIGLNATIAALFLAE